MTSLELGAAPALPGTYLLRFDLQQTLHLHWPQVETLRLPPGPYAYIGSALGPGGLKARLRRHDGRSSVRPARWHVDRITAQVPPSAVYFLVSGQRLECCWVQALIAGGAGCPAPGFGSSDCRLGCPAHLLSLPVDWSKATLEELLS